ncbi:hypothetical protein NQ315_008794 [Exocentrus adspersus]|uniref:Regulatory protein zeste n=1 Tax=Exocentrus adspersus TaxID=1586481 RepID=A0AAV8VHP0_9CUCU|nr:hypothetical protein NQ315_008794 [Exocentrus adspersus]
MRVTTSYWEAFLEAAEINPLLITNKFNGIQGKATGNDIWKSVAQKLNGLGYGVKTVQEWRRAVTDWKCKVKSKASKLRAAAVQTGGGSTETPPLTPLEEKLLALMGTKCIEGDKAVQELGQHILRTKVVSTRIIYFSLD